MPMFTKKKGKKSSVKFTELPNPDQEEEKEQTILISKRGKEDKEDKKDKKDKKEVLTGKDLFRQKLKERKGKVDKISKNPIKSKDYFRKQQTMKKNRGKKRTRVSKNRIKSKDHFRKVRDNRNKK